MDEKFMKEAIKEALKGKDKTGSNPLVGCVIVKDGEIISRGSHLKFGSEHAEINALNNCLSPKKLINSTIYITMEPCAHYGKQPPCVDEIIKCGIKRAVIGQMDPNLLVKGKGINRLIDSGISVETMVLEHEVKQINKMYNHFHEQGTPFICLKVATSVDGKVGIRDVGNAQISSDIMKSLVDKDRGNHQSICVGSETVIIDNPTLLNRSGGSNPIRVVLDGRGRLRNHPNLNVFLDNASPVLIYTSEFEEWHNPEHVEIVKIEDMSLKAVLNNLKSRNIQSIYVEGGPNLHDSFISEGFWNMLRINISPKMIGGDGVSMISSKRKSMEISSVKISEVKVIEQEIILEIENEEAKCLQD